MRRYGRSGPALVTAALAATTLAGAATINLTGNLNSDDQVAYYDLTVNPGSQVTLQTTSYAAGDFPTVISLFNSLGAFLATSGASGATSCTGSGQSAVPPVSGTTPVCGDAYLSESLSAATYIVALGEFPNFPSPSGTNVNNAFQFTGQGDFTSGPNGCGVGSGGFYDLAGQCERRGSAFALSISGTGVVSTTPLALTSAALPEPSSLLLTVPALLWVFRRRRVAGMNECAQRQAGEK